MGDLSANFDSSEFACRDACGFGTHPGDVSPVLIEKLEAMRPLTGPMKVNSACRCPKHNTEIGGSAASAHTGGQAVDINCPSSQRAFQLVKYAYLAGFRRIGIERGCIHLDVSATLPQEVLFGWDRAQQLQKLTTGENADNANAAGRRTRPQAGKGDV